MSWLDNGAGMPGSSPRRDTCGRRAWVGAEDVDGDVDVDVVGVAPVLIRSAWPLVPLHAERTTAAAATTTGRRRIQVSLRGRPQRAGRAPADQRPGPWSS